MKFRRYISESVVEPSVESTIVEEVVTPAESVVTEDLINPDAPSLARETVDAFYAPVEKLLKDGKFDEARTAIEELERDLAEFEAENNKKIFKFPKFMIDSQKKQIEALKAKLPPVIESIDDMDRRCEKCNTLLNDGGTCPKCDDGEEDYGDEMTESMEVVAEDLSVREKLKRAYPELDFDREPVTEEVVAEELSNKEKLQRAFPELNFSDAVTEECKESITEDTYDEYDDEYDIEDDVELDRRHAALYGGDRMYCDCGAKLSYDERGSYCPECEPRDPEDVYDDDIDESCEDCCKSDLDDDID